MSRKFQIDAVFASQAALRSTQQLRAEFARLRQTIDNALNKSAGAGFKSLPAKTQASKRALDDLNKSGRDLASGLGQLDPRLGRIGSLLSTVASPAGVLGLALGAIVAGMGAATVEAIQFESAFAGVVKTLDATPIQLERIRGELLQLSTEIPVTATELAGIGEIAGQLGVKAENVTDFTRTVADLGVASNLSGEEGAKMIARFANITQVDQSEYSNIASSIVDLGNNSATTEAEIASMALRIAAAGTAVGASAGEILGFSAALSSVGIQAEAGGTSLSKFFFDLQNEVANGGERLEGFAAVAGMSVAEFSRLFKEDATGAVVQFAKGLGEFQKAGGETSVIFENLEIEGVRLRAALGAMALNSDGLTASIERGSTAYRENVALTEEARKRYATTASQAQLLANDISRLAIITGTALAPAVNAAIQELRPLAADMTEVAKAVTALAAAQDEAAPKIDKTNQSVLKQAMVMHDANTPVGAFAMAWESVVNMARNFNIDQTITARIRELGQVTDPAAAKQIALSEAVQRTVDATKFQTEVMRRVNELLGRNTEEVKRNFVAWKDSESAYRESKNVWRELRDEMREGTPQIEDANRAASAAAPAFDDLSAAQEKSAASSRALNDALPPMNVNLTKAAEIARDLINDQREAAQSTQDHVDAVNVLTGELNAGNITWAEYEAALEVINDKLAKNRKTTDDVKESTSEAGRITRQVSTIFTDFGRDLAELVVQGGSLGDVFDSVKTAVLRLVAEEAMGALIRQMKTLITQIPMLEKLKSVLGGIFSGGRPFDIGDAFGLGGGGGGGGGSGLGSLLGSGGGDPITGAITAGSAIFGNFQMARMNQELKFIGHWTKLGAIALGGETATGLGGLGLRDTLFDVSARVEPLAGIFVELQFHTNELRLIREALTSGGIKVDGIGSGAGGGGADIQDVVDAVEGWGISEGQRAGGRGRGRSGTGMGEAGELPGDVPGLPRSFRFRGGDRGHRRTPTGAAPEEIGGLFGTDNPTPEERRALEAFSTAGPQRDEQIDIAERQLVETQQQNRLEARWNQLRLFGQQTQIQSQLNQTASVGDMLASISATVELQTEMRDTLAQFTMVAALDETMAFGLATANTHLIGVKNEVAMMRADLGRLADAVIRGTSPTGPPAPDLGTRSSRARGRTGAGRSKSGDSTTIVVEVGEAVNADQIVDAIRKNTKGVRSEIQRVKV